MPVRRTVDEQTLGGAVIHWGRERPATQHVLVTYPCCGRTLSRTIGTGLRYLRIAQPVLCEACCRRGERAYQWTGEQGSVSAGHQRARKQYDRLGLCEHCGQQPAVERHHKDGDPRNNRRENVLFACRRCHMLLDGRLEATRERAVARPGERNGRSKLTWEQVRQIRALWDQGLLSQGALARNFGVSPGVIGAICRRDRWRDAQDTLNNSLPDGSTLRRPSRKLEAEQVVEIRRRYAAGEPVRVLAVEYSVVIETIYDVVYRRTWAHVPQDTVMPAQSRPPGVKLADWAQAGRAQARQHDARSTCAHGHPWTDETTYYDPDGIRECRICRAESRRAWSERHKSTPA